MTEEKRSDSEERADEFGRQSPWIKTVKVLLYILAAGVLLILLVFGTCVLLLRR